MTTTTSAAVPTTLTDDDVVALAARVGRVAAEFDAGHDRDATFVTEAYDEMHACGYLRLPVPTELGGLGASMRQVVLAEEELGSHSGAAALSAAMHLYLTLVQRWRWRRGAPDAEGVLRKVAADGLVLATSGGSDWVCPSTTAVAVPGGYRLDGRKQFCTPGAGRRGDLDVGDARRTRPGRRRAARRRAAVRRPGSRSSRPGTRWACAGPRATTSCSTGCSCPRRR